MASFLACKAISHQFVGQEKELLMDLEKAAREIVRLMLPHLNVKQNRQLEKVLSYCLFDEERLHLNEPVLNNDKYLEMFLSAKRLEGCSERTLSYYETTISKLLRSASTPACDLGTEQIRTYLSEYQQKTSVSQVTVDNVRRIVSSFYSWLEDEDHIIKSPVRRIKRVKAPQTVKEVYSDEVVEILCDNSGSPRNLALIDLLRSTGMRVGELVSLNRDSVDVVNRECVVHGKGNKDRIVYFDAKTKVHLERYLMTRTDSSEALFVSCRAPYKRLQISGVEALLRKLGRKLNVGRVHPHKFRRTLATRAIDKGMPIEQVQVLLGHKKIDTTLRYAMVDQRNVKASHRKYLT